MAGKKTPKEAGSEYLQELLKKVPEAQRAQVAQVLASVDDFVVELGNGYKRQDESSRLVQEAIEAQKKADAAKAEAESLLQQNRGWYEKNVQNLAHYSTLVQRAGGDPTALEKMIAATGGNPPAKDPDDSGGEPKVDLTKYVSVDKLPELIAQQVGPQARNLEIIATYGPVLAARHAHEFKDSDGNPEILDLGGLIKFANEKRYSDLTQAYNAFVYDKRVAAGQEKYKHDIAEAEKRGEEKALEKLRASGLPYPVTNLKPEDMSAVDVIMGGTDRSKFTVDQAAQAYLKGASR